MNSKRRSKRELVTISDDDSTSDQPTEKSKKGDSEPIPSPEVVELRQKVVELEQKLLKSDKTMQGACRIAGEAQARVQFLENLVDSKPKVIDGAKNKEREEELEKKVYDLTNQLEERMGRSRDHERLAAVSSQLEASRKEAQTTNDKNIELFRENDTLKLEMRRLSAVSSQLVASRKEIENECGKNRELCRENESLKLEMAEMRRIAQQLQQQPPQLLHMQLQPPPGSIQAQQDHPNAQNTCAVAPPPVKIVSIYDLVPGSTDTPMLHAIAHPTNILQICHPGTPNTLFLDTALNKLETIMNELGRKNVFKEIGIQLKGRDFVDIKCEVCQSILANSTDALNHFLSVGHIRKVRSHGGVVSLAAFRLWSLPLQQTSDAPTAASSVIIAAPATAACPDVRGAMKKVREENRHGYDKKALQSDREKERERENRKQITMRNEKKEREDSKGRRYSPPRQKPLMREKKKALQSERENERDRENRKQITMGDEKREREHSKGRRDSPPRQKPSMREKERERGGERRDKEGGKERPKSPDKERNRLAS